MAQIRGTAGYGMGPQGAPAFGGGPGFGAAPMPSQYGSDPSPLDQIKKQTEKIEDILDTFAEPLKP
jgi:ER-derived vesicles protein